MNSESHKHLRGKVKQLRKHVIDMVYHAQSGHPGGSLSACEIMVALYFDQMNLTDPKDPNRDRFILSKGHVCPVLYATLFMRGFLEEKYLGTLRQFGSPLQGHPIIGKVLGIEVTSGSLGIGFGEALGIALDRDMRKGNYFVYTLLGDGETQEGIVWEVAQSANKYRLKNFIAIVDKNGIQNDASVEEIMPVGDLGAKFRAFGWDVIDNIDGHDIDKVIEAIVLAKKKSANGPVVIVANTIKGKGVSFMENNVAWHGNAPNQEQYHIAIKDIEQGG